METPWDDDQILTAVTVCDFSLSLHGAAHGPEGTACCRRLGVLPGSTPCMELGKEGENKQEGKHSLYLSACPRKRDFQKRERSQGRHQQQGGKTSPLILSKSIWISEEFITQRWMAESKVGSRDGQAYIPHTAQLAWPWQSRGSWGASGSQLRPDATTTTESQEAEERHTNISDLQWVKPQPQPFRGEGKRALLVSIQEQIKPTFWSLFQNLPSL